MLLAEVDWEAVIGILLNVSKILYPIAVVIAYHYVKKRIEHGFNTDLKINEEIREIKRKRYEEFVVTIEAILARIDDKTNKERMDELNLIYSKMFLVVPDEVVISIKKHLEGKFDAKKSKKIYLELRKDLLGKTSVEEDDICVYFGEKKNN